MKYQIVLLFLASVCFENAISLNEAQMKAGIKLIKNTCRTKTKITDEQIAKMHEGVWDDADDVTKCYCHCALGMMKMQAKNGAFEYELFEKQKPMIPETIRETLIASVDNCINAGEGLTKKCDLSYAFFKCVYLYDPEHYMFP
uniref:Odorant binding protein 3 n=1 Tax=Anomala corpulenta TaxID=931571 RepID=A0A0A7HFA1_9SCAR|nr:odorant binding protein 3-like protein [Anomala corpulenta]AKC58524.1 odorant binding protein 3 [Anomala corpulenta]